MRIAVVGLGSMGQRRIRLLKSRFDVSSEDIVGIDLDEKKRSQAAQEYGIFTSDDMEGYWHLKTLMLFLSAQDLPLMGR